MATVEKEQKSINSYPSVDERTAVLEEVELLEAIYINELTVDLDDEGRPTCVKILLHPATGEDVDQQYVCLTLEFIIPSDYPMAIPDIIMKNSRGLADDHVISLRKALHELATEREGGQMLYELIEVAKESLTQCNVPHGSCIICLEDFLNNDAFIKTECYHYFHHHCLMRYVKHSLAEFEAEREEATKQKHMEFEVKKVVCPVCREYINYEPDNLASASEYVDNEPSVHLSDEIREMQQKMSELFQKQKAKGGMIDVEAEKNKYYLSLNSASVPAEPGSSSAAVGVTSGYEDQEPAIASDLSVPDTGMARESLERKELRTGRIPIDRNKGRDKRNRKTGFQPSKKEGRKYREELPKERKKPEAADRRTPIGIDAGDETNITSVNPDERDISEESMKAVIGGTTEPENHRANSGRGRGRGYRSNRGKYEYRRYDEQRKYKRKDGYKGHREGVDSESLGQRRDYNDWGEYENMTQCGRTSASDRRPKKQGIEGKDREKSEGKDRERSEIFKLDKEVAERKSEESFSNGHIELVDTGKMHSMMLTSEQCIDSPQKGPGTAKSDRFRNEGIRAPPGFKIRGSYSEYRGGKRRPTRSKYEDFR